MKELVPNKKSVLVPFAQSVQDSLNKSDLDGYSDNTNGCIFEHGKFAFICKGSLMQIVNIKSGQQCSACDFSTIEQKVGVTCVISYKRKFIVGLRCIGTANIGLLCVYDPGLSRIVKTIRMNGIPNSIALVREFGGVNVETSLFSPVLRSLFGIIAVGTEDGHLLLIDLRADESIDGQSVTSPSTLLYVDTIDIGNIPKMRDKARASAQHCCLDLTNEYVTQSGFKYSMPNAKAKLCDRNNCGITSLLYLRQSISLVVGYSFGAFQIWSLETLKIIHSSQLVMASPVCHFTYQEPENDPRSCFFLWVGRGPLPAQSLCLNPTSVTMYQIVYADKEQVEGYGMLYKQLGLVAKRFEHQLTGDVHHLVDSTSIGSRIISFKTLESSDSTVSVVVWETPVTPTNMNLTCHIGIFDLNCYYEKQLPSSVREAMYGKMEAVCPFFAFYSLTDVAEDFIPTGILDVFLDPQSINWFRTSVPPQIEQFSWPSSASFQLTCLSEGGTIGVEMLGMQKQIISNMIDMGPDSFLDINKLIQQCCVAGLLHSSYSCIKENEESLYTDALLSIALDNGGMVFITSCIRKWSHGSITHAGHSLKLLHDWAWAQVVQRKRFLDELHFFLFGSADEGLDEGQLHQLKRISVQLRDLTEVLKELKNSKASSLEEGIRELAMKSQVTLHLTMYADILLLLVDSELLPEQENCSQNNKPTYNALLLSEYYEVRRKTAGTEDDLFIDAMWKNMNFPETLKEENNVVLYPPSSVEVMCSLFVHNMLNNGKKCCYIFYYWFLDICECFTDLHDKNAESKFKQFMQLESNEELLIKSIWLLDHKLYNEAVTHLLVVDVNISSVYYHHIVKLLYEEGQKDLLALFFANKQPNDSCTMEQMKFLTFVMLQLGKLSNAYELQKTSIYTTQKESIFHFFIEQCIQNQLFQKLFMLPLSAEEENILHNYLQSSRNTEDYLLVYYLERGLYNEASKLTKSLQAVSTLKLDQVSQDRLQTQCLLANGFSQTIPHIQHKRNDTVEQSEYHEFKSPLSSILLKGDKNVAHNTFMSASKEELNFSMNNSAKRRKCPLFEAEPVFSKKPKDMDISVCNIEMSSPVTVSETIGTKDSNPLSLLTTPASAKRRYSKISVSNLNKAPQSILKMRTHIQQEIETPISSGKRIRFVDAKSPDSPSLDGSFIDTHNKGEVSFVSNNAENSFESVSEGELVDEEMVEERDDKNAYSELVKNDEPIHTMSKSKPLLDIEDILSDLESDDCLVEQPIKSRRLSSIAQENIKEMLLMSREIESGAKKLSSGSEGDLTPEFSPEDMETEVVAVIDANVASSVPGMESETKELLAGSEDDSTPEVSTEDIVTEVVAVIDTYDASSVPDMPSNEVVSPPSKLSNVPLATDQDRNDETHITSLIEDTNDKSDNIIPLEGVDKCDNLVVLDSAGSESEIIGFKSDERSLSVTPSEQCKEQAENINLADRLNVENSRPVNEIPCTGAASDNKIFDAHVSINNETVREDEIVISDDDDENDDDDDDQDETTTDDSDESDNERNSVDNSNEEEKLTNKDFSDDLGDDIYEDMEPVDDFDDTEDIYENMDIADPNNGLQLNQLVCDSAGAISSAGTEMDSYIGSSNVCDMALGRSNPRDVSPVELVTKTIEPQVKTDLAEDQSENITYDDEQSSVPKETEVLGEIDGSSQLTSVTEDAALLRKINVEKKAVDQSTEKQELEPIEDHGLETDRKPGDVIDIVDIDDDDDDAGDDGDDETEEEGDGNNEIDGELEEENADVDDNESLEDGELEDGELDTEESQYDDSDESDSSDYEENEEDNLGQVRDTPLSHAIVVLDDDEDDEVEGAGNLISDQGEDEPNLPTSIEEVIVLPVNENVLQTEVLETEEIKTDRSLSVPVESEEDDERRLNQRGCTSEIPVEGMDIANKIELDQKSEGTISNPEENNSFVKESPLIDLPSVSSEATLTEKKEDCEVAEEISQMSSLIPHQIESVLDTNRHGSYQEMDVMEICETDNLETSSEIQQPMSKDISQLEASKTNEEMEVSSDISVHVITGEEDLTSKDTREDMEITVTSDHKFVFPRSAIIVSKLEPVDQGMDDSEHLSSKICSTPIHSYNTDEGETDTTALSTVHEVSDDEMSVNIGNLDVLDKTKEPNNVQIGDEDQNMTEDDSPILTKISSQLSQNIEGPHSLTFNLNKEGAESLTNLTGHSATNVLPERSPIFLPSKVAEADDSESDESSDENTSVVTPVRALRRRTVYRRDHLTPRTNKFRIKPDATVDPEELSEKDAQVSDSDAQVFEERYKTAQAAYETKSETKTVPRRMRTSRRKVSECHSDSSVSSADSHRKVGDGSSKYFTIDDDKSSDEEIEIQSEDLEIYLGLKRNTTGRIRGLAKEHDMEPIEEEDSLLEGKGDVSMLVDIDFTSDIKKSSDMQLSDAPQTSVGEKSKVGSNEVLNEIPSKEMEQSSGSDDQTEALASSTKRLTRRSHVQSEPRETRLRGSAPRSLLNSGSRRTTAAKASGPISVSNMSSFNEPSEMELLSSAFNSSKKLEVRVEELSPQLPSLKTEAEMVVNLDRLAPLSSEEPHEIEESSTDSEKETITRRSTRAQNKAAARTTRSGRKPVSDQHIKTKSSRQSPKKNESKKVKPFTEPIEIVQPKEVIKYEESKKGKTKKKGKSKVHDPVGLSSEESGEVADDVFLPRTTRSQIVLPKISSPVKNKISKKTRQSNRPSNQDFSPTDSSQDVSSDALVIRNDHEKKILEKISKTRSIRQTITDQSLPKINETVLDNTDLDSTKSVSGSRFIQKKKQNQLAMELTEADNSAEDTKSTKTSNKTRSTSQINQEQSLDNTASVENSTNNRSSLKGTLNHSHMDTGESSISDLTDTGTKIQRNTRSTRQANLSQLTLVSGETSADVKDTKEEKMSSPVKKTKSPTKKSKLRTSRSTATRKLRNRDVKT